MICKFCHQTRVINGKCPICNTVYAKDDTYKHWFFKNLKEEEKSAPKSINKELKDGRTV